ncbi:hypothetical protein CYMTET_30911 [Cymbomonas tetramitiformis]|uniref:CSD domain-containing protein n=1 Tax=Cymbomonas tetramitiformis TaxID=36881 RepID=A0AAE0KTH0_9CHLO|nr:hypothetical protein CYMTET_30911 [Cymbomonas tetramitiformis]
MRCSKFFLFQNSSFVISRVLSHYGNLPTQIIRPFSKSGDTQCASPRPDAAQLPSKLAEGTRLCGSKPRIITRRRPLEGTVVRWNEWNGIGLIEVHGRASASEDKCIYVHHSQLKNTARMSNACLSPGQKVEFRLGRDGRGRLRAEHVTASEGRILEGCHNLTAGDLPGLS